MSTRTKKTSPIRHVIRKAVNSWKVVLSLYVAAVLISALVFGIAEGKPFGQSLWWAFITALTIGYGDIFPVTMAGRITGVLLAHFVVLVVAPMVIAHLTLRLVEDADAFTDSEQRKLMDGQDELHHKMDQVLRHLGLQDSREHQDADPR